MPKPMHRSRSQRRLQRVSPKGRNIIHYKRKTNRMPSCGICGKELNGIALTRSGGRSRRTNSRLFGGVLCAKCTSQVIKSASRIEQGDMKLNDISIRQRAFVLQMISH